LSCENGRFNIVKWLWEIYNHKINIHAKDEYAFRLSCENEYFEVAKWLWIISNKSIKYDIAFKYKKKIKKIIYDDRKLLIHHRKLTRSLK
jgi:hypothetical protein